ncbi:ribosomal protein S5-alanine N-acetyltransferase [Streptomyces glaucosporus]|uniref:Ribosomal protein S5-alanine N-acetyltransferase n=1 Tax=Streptomyces glaucosporus TaxID=284044 RepID=A0ABP5UQ00_9ACTN
MSVTRIASVGDAEALADQVRANRAFLAPWEPARSDAYFTVEGQRAVLEDNLDAYARGSMVPLVIVDEDDRPIGRVNINNIVRGAFQSAALGYWVSESHNGRGIASAAVAEAVELAFGKLGLHRLQAETLPHNTASQRVLARNGFQPFAVAPSYLKIAGEWRDHILYHRINPS